MEVRIMGLEEAERRLADLGSSVEEVKNAYVVVGTNVEYAWGIEFGRKRNGQLARKLGGSFALTDAFEQVQPRIGPEIAWALAVKWARSGNARGLLATMIALGNDVLTRTKELLLERVYSVPIPTTRGGRPKWRRTRTLSRSYHVEAFGAGTRGNLRTLYSAARRVR